MTCTDNVFTRLLNNNNNNNNNNENFIQITFLRYVQS